MIAERGIVAENQQPGGVLIQPAHRKHEVLHTTEQIVNRWSAVWVLISGQVALGFVEQQVTLLACGQRMSIERNLIALRINPDIRRLHLLAVDGDPPGANPTARLSPRSNSEFGQNPV